MVIKKITLGHSRQEYQPDNALYYNLISSTESKTFLIISSKELQGIILLK